MPIPNSVAGRFAVGVALPFRGVAYLAGRRALWRDALFPVLLTIAGLVAGLAVAAPLSGKILSLLWAKPEGLLGAAWWVTRATLYLVLVYLAAVALPVTSALRPARARRRLAALPRFVNTRGGEYFFVPGKRALAWLARRA